MMSFSVTAQPASPRQLLLVSLLIFATAAAFYLMPLVIRGELNRPPEPGDGPDYEAIAFQLVRGNGFSVDWDEAEYRAAYAGRPGYEYLLSRTGSHATAYRPPLLPLLMAGSYKLFGRQFAPVRTLNCLLMALTISLAAGLVMRRCGMIPGLIAAALFITDSRVQVYAGYILTESLACALTMLLVWSLVRLNGSNRISGAVVAGLLAGVTVLTRSLILLWLPFLVLLVYFAGREPKAGLWCRRGLMTAGLFIVSLLVVPLPWMIRNCVVLEKFSPLGTQSGIGLPGGYSDRAWLSQGVWFDASEAGLFRVPAIAGLDAEKNAAADGQALALAWIRANPEKLPALFWYKVRDLWRPVWWLDALVIPLALIGCLFYPRRSEATVLAGMVIANTIAVGLTWSVGDRFLLPVLALVYLLAAVGLWICLLKAAQRFSRISQLI
jgi:4-amino-4-deoxy-L-arabinose transferase-like glycosyltransferase